MKDYLLKSQPNETNHNSALLSPQPPAKPADEEDPVEPVELEELQHSQNSPKLANSQLS